MVINIPNGDKPSGGGGCGTGGCSTGGTCGSGLEKVYPTAAVRYGYMRAVGEFRYPAKGMVFGCGANVVIQTNRGIEIGEMVSLTCDGCDKCVTRDQIKKYVEASGAEHYTFSNGKILRLASEEDVGDWEHIRAETLRKRDFCQQQADRHKLPMKVLECEHLFGGERIIFYFMADTRVDFRGLVKELAEEFQTRIEMRQVGARDEARLLADYETCGRECCCRNFLKTLKPVSMKMAKMQKATLDPAKVSGRCGRLKCCLRYEHTSYEELDRKLPRIGARVIAEEGTGTVVARQILTQLLQVKTDDGGRFTVAAEALLTEEEANRLKAARDQAAAAAAAEAAQSRASRGDKADGAKDGDSSRRRSRRPRRSRRRPGDAQQASSGGAEGANAQSPPKKRSPDNTPPERKAGPPAQDGSGGNGTNADGEGDKPRRRRRRGRRSRGRGGQERPGDAGGKPPEAAS